MTTRTLVAQLQTEGFNAYPRDGRPGAVVVEIDNFIFELDEAGVYDVMTEGKTTVKEGFVTLNFVPREQRDAIVAAGTGVTHPAANVRDALKVARKVLA